MIYNIARGVLLRWVEEKKENEKNPPITYLRDKHFVEEVFRTNNEAFKASFDGYAELIKSFFVLYEKGQVKQTEKFEGEGDDKKSLGFSSDLLEGKTFEEYKIKEDEFLKEQVEIKVNPIVINRTPFVLNR